MPLFGSDSLCAGAPQDVCNFLRGIAVKIHGNLDQACQLLVPLRRGRGFDVSTGRTCPRCVRAADGLDEDVASLHAAFLHDMLNCKLGAAASVEFSDDRSFQKRSPWVDESANNRPARTKFQRLSDLHLKRVDGRFEPRAGVQNRIIPNRKEARK